MNGALSILFFIQNNCMTEVLIAGGTGLIGKRLSVMLRERGYRVAHLSRHPDPAADFPAYHWDVAQGVVDETAIRNADFVINLAGAGIADKRWTPDRKRLITESRVGGAQVMLETFRRLDCWPRAYLSSAAIGYYGDSGNEWVDERTPPGTGFLSESCVAWEGAIEKIMATGLRTVALRIGIVLSAKGGALPQMLLPLRFFLGVYFGSGRQWYSWIHIDDVCRMFIHAMEKESVQGIYNAVAPHPERNKDFVRTLRHAYGRPALLAPAPAFLMRLALGEMADVVLTGSRAANDKIRATGFTYEYPELRPALLQLLGKSH